MKNGCVTLRNAEMFYASFGRGQKSLVVLPGLSDGLATVRGKALLLAPPYRRFFKDYTVYMFSRKDPMPQGYTMRDMAHDQAAAMRALDIAKASVLGVSQGGMVSQYLAIDHPEMVGRLVLAVTAPYANDVVREAVSSWIDMAERGNHASLMADTAERMYSGPYLEKNRRWQPLIARLTKPKSYERFFRNAYAILGFDVRDELHRIACPAPIIAGDADKTVGTEAAAELAAGIPNSEVLIYEGLGHGVFEEANDFYDKVYEFCEAR